MQSIKVIPLLFIMLVLNSTLFSANVAQLGTATQSSTFSPPENAIDINDGSSSLTLGNDDYQWWHLDLGANYAIDSINLRVFDINLYRWYIRGARVMVSDTPFVTGTTASNLSASQSQAAWKDQVPLDFDTTEYNFPSVNVHGRYILIQKATDGYDKYLGMAEVEVFGHKIIPPTANAGPDQIVAPGTSIALSGSGTDTDGTIVSYLWTEEGVPLSNSASFSKNDFALGTHTLTLTVTDNDGETATDTMTVTIADTSLTANAGPDQTVLEGNIVTFDGSGSSDKNGDIVSYVWSYDGTQIATGVSGTYDTAANSMDGGIYNILLTVTNDEGIVATDIVIITVTEAQVPPIMNAIPTQSFTKNTAGNTINLTTFVTLTNGDPIISYTLNGALPAGMFFNTATGIINGTPTEEGDFNLTAYATDDDGESNSVNFTLRITPIVAITNNYRDFALRFQKTFPGKLVTIANTILVAPKTQDEGICDTYTNGSYLDDTDKSNSSYKLCSYWRDTTATFPTTQAQLPMPTTGAEIVWAGLYWQALVPNTVDVTTMQIQVKFENNATYTSREYQAINFDTLDYLADAGNPGDTSYSAFADMTSYFRDNNFTNGYFTVGDVPIKEGTAGALGTYGAWALVVIYKDSTEPLRNFSIYDGWKQIDSNSGDVNIDISGFRAPKQPIGKPPIDISSSASVFVVEGDKYIPNDYLTAQPSKKTSSTTLTHTSGQTFYSSIETTSPFDRTPNPSNNQGIDIQEFDLGTTGYNVIEPEENSIQFTFSSIMDTYWPSLITFAAELHVPEICYDYTVSVGDYIRIPSDNRDINTPILNNLPINIQFALRSEEADFIYLDTKARVSFSGTSAARLSYNRNHVQMSPPTINNYFKISDGYDEIEANASIGQIGIGADVIGIDPNNGGKISPNETTYAILGYDISGTDDISTHFDLIFNTKIQFDPFSTPVDYVFSTATTNNTKHISRCPTNPIYDPVYMNFNVERVGTQDEPLSSRYTLHTQVTGRPYQLDITSYQDSNRSGGAHTPENFAGTIEVELIDGGGFKNSSSAGYDMVCDKPESKGEGSLIAFNPNNTESRHTIKIPDDLPNYLDTLALRSAVLRLWIIAAPEANGDRRIISHQCTDKTNADGCFTDIYTQDIDVNATGSCVSQCSGTNSSCYSCLKRYYAVSVCSRDNFAIRPASYHIKLSDDGDDGLGNPSVPLGENKTSLNNQDLAAEYSYILDINATNFLADTPALKYFAYQFNTGEYTSLPNPLTSGNMAAIEFDDLTSCNDKNSSTISIKFFDSMVQNVKFDYNNVGQYKFWIADSNWTAVDQQSSGHKPVFDNAPVDDCEVDSANNALNTKAGCAIYSIRGDKVMLNLNFKPYQFDVSDVNYSLNPSNDNNMSFMNDFSNADYYTSNNIGMQDPIMATIFEGNVTAEGKNGTVLSNYTIGCAAEDVRINLYRTTNPTEETLEDSPYNTQLQQYLQYGAISNAIFDSQTGRDKNLTLPKAAFSDAQEGIAKMHLYTTFKKPLDNPINPIEVQYNDINATGDSSLSSANKGTHTPKGTRNYDVNMTYVYGKISPQKRLYKDVLEDYVQTPLYVDIYCDNGLLTAPKDCNNTYGLGTKTLGEDEEDGWFLSTIFDNSALGTTDIIVSHLSEEASSPQVTADGNTKATKNSDVDFDDNIATQNDINVSVPPNTNRATVVKVKYEPVPWLINNPATDYFRIRFITPAEWAGVGKVGHVTDTSSSEESAPRMNW